MWLYKKFQQISFVVCNQLLDDMGSAVDFMAIVTDPRDLSVRVASAARELSLVSHNEKWCGKYLKQIL